MSTAPSADSPAEARPAPAPSAADDGARDEPAAAATAPLPAGAAAGTAAANADAAAAAAAAKQPRRQYGTIVGSTVGAVNGYMLSGVKPIVDPKPGDAPQNFWIVLRRDNLVALDHTSNVLHATVLVDSQSADGKDAKPEKVELCLSVVLRDEATATDVYRDIGASLKLTKAELRRL